jgi:uncharacterized membrane protein
MSQYNTLGRAAAARASDDRGLRPGSFAAVVMLILEFGLGSWVSLYAQIPVSDQGKGAFAAFGAAVAHGPAGLALHALLGTLLLVTAITLVIRAAVARRAAASAISAVALLAVIAAWLSGARFVGSGSNGASLGMAMATAVALLCYAIILFAPRLTQGPGR